MQVQITRCKGGKYTCCGCLFSAHLSSLTVVRPEHKKFRGTLLSVNLATIQEAIRDAVVSATGVPDVDVYWAGSKEAGYAHKSPKVELSCPAFVKVGQGERRAEYVPGVVATRTITHVGDRRLTVTVKFEVDDQTPGVSGLYYASRLATRINFRAPVALLKPAKCAVTWVSGARSADYVTQNRKVSVYVVEMIVHAAEVDIDTTGDQYAQAWIERAAGQGEAATGNDLAGTEFDTGE